MTAENPLRVVIFRDGDFWVAQCLEHDIGAQARDIPTLQRNFALTVDLEAKVATERGVAPFSDIDPAPDKFVEMWDKVATNLRSSNHADTVCYDMALVA